MTLRGIRRRLSALGIGILLVGARLTAGTDPAWAQERNLVILGDSAVADPPFLEHLQANSSFSPGGRTADQCVTSDYSYAIQAAQQLGLVPRDYSCTGATAFTPSDEPFAGQVDRAVTDGALNVTTARVVLTMGINDTYTNIDLSAEEIRARFIESMVPHIKEIKTAAPNARIQIVGYPTITDGDFVCLVHVGGNLHDRTYLPAAGLWEGWAQQMQRELAQVTGTEFVDLKPSTADNGMCSPDHRRMWSGFIDVAAGPVNFPAHLNARGHEHVAGVITSS